MNNSDTTVTILGPAVGYVDLLDHETLTAINDPAAAPTNKYYPLRPSAAGNCTRELAYALNEYHGFATYPKKNETAESHRLLNLGGYIENHVLGQFQKHLGKLLMLKYKQQTLDFYKLDAKVHPELSANIEGSLDAVFWSEKYRAVIDIKSKKDKFSQFYKTDWDATSSKLANMKSVTVISEKAFWVEDLEAFVNELKDPFFQSNFVQLNGYACNEFLQKRGVTHAAIIQYSKNDSRLREIRFKPSMAVYEKTKAKFQAALDAVDAGNPELAKRDYTIGTIKCAFCKFSSTCWGGEDTLKAYFKTFPKRQWPELLGDNNPEIRKLFAEFEDGALAVANQNELETKIIGELANVGVGLVKLEDNGHVYEVKHYATRPNYRLKRGK